MSADIALHGYPTPETTPMDTICRQLNIPDDPLWIAAVSGALLRLTRPSNWQPYGAVTTDEAAAAALVMVNTALESTTCGATTVPTPFWDDASDTDDENPIDAPVWYGSVTDPDIPPSLTFAENALLWTFTGILAVGVSPLVAIAFVTVAPKLVVAVKSGDPLTVIRVWMDDILQGEFTDADAVDGIINIPAYGDPSLSTHNLYVVNVS